MLPDAPRCPLPPVCTVIRWSGCWWWTITRWCGEVSSGLLDAEDDIEVVGEAGTAVEAVRRTGFDSPDVVVLDVRLPDGSGVEACREIKAAFPQVEVLILTSFADEEALLAAILAGASGYLLKRIDGPALVEAVRKVGAGESLLDPEMTDPLFRGCVTASPRTRFSPGSRPRSGPSSPTSPMG